MTYEINSLRSVRTYVEPNRAAYGVANSTEADFLDTPINEGFSMASPEREMLDPKVSQVRLDGRAKKVVGRQSAAVQMSMSLGGHGVDMVGNETQPDATTWALYRLFLATMGGVMVTGTEAAATTVQSGTTTTAVNVNSGHGDRWSPGKVIGCITARGYEAREVLSVSGDTVNVKQAFSGIPTTGQSVRGGFTFYMTEDPASSLQFLMQGREADDNFLATGCQGGFQIEARPGQIAKVTFDFKGDATTKLAAHSGIRVPTFANFVPIATTGSELTVPVVGSTTRVAPAVSDVTLALGILYEQVTGYGANNRICMRRQPPRDGVLARLTMTVPFEDGTWIDARDNREDRANFFQIGNTPGATWLVSLPTVNVASPIGRTPSGTAISGQQVVFESRHDASAIAGTSPESYSALRLHAL